MVLNSLDFVIFFLIVFAFNFIFKGKRAFQNAFLLISSYFFYAYIDWKMLPVLILMTVYFFYSGQWVDQLYEKGKDQKANRLSMLTVAIGLLPLLYFKYFNFFVDSVFDFIQLLGFKVEYTLLQVLMPLGISFFTFRLLSYVIEINRGRITPSKDMISFATYVAFFPSMLSGPIDRPYNFLPQLEKPRDPSYEMLKTGLERFVWGWFIKVCIADRIAFYTSSIFDAYDAMNSSSLIVATLLYPFQLYADFSGYTHMAIGIALMLGLKITENFNHPFFAQNVAEYWRRWHMSLTTWLTDYVFMPLNVKFRTLGKWGLILAISINFILIGFWHGAYWTFGAFGLYYAILYIPLVLSGNMNKKDKFNWIHGWIIPPKNFLKMVFTYLLVAIGLVIFRAPNLTDAWHMFQGMIGNYGMPDLSDKTNILLFVFFSLFLIVRDYQEEVKAKHILFKSNNVILFNISMIVLLLFIIMFRGDVAQPFVYIQF